jgi:hypothetical protein
MATGAPEQAVEPRASATTQEQPMEKASVPVISEATVSFRNDVGDKFQLVQARFTMDGIELPAVSTEIPPGRDMVVFKGPMSSGRHVITSYLKYQGRNRAIFTYLEGYAVNLDATDQVFVVSGEPASVTIVAREQKGFTTPYEKSLAITFETRGGATDVADNASAARRASR